MELLQAIEGSLRSTMKSTLIAIAATFRLVAHVPSSTPSTTLTNNVVVAESGAVESDTSNNSANAYTTVVTMLTIMVSKRLVRKRRRPTGHVYEALVQRAKASSNMLRELIDKVYDGSTLAVVQSLLDSTEIDADELAQIRRLVNRKAKEQS